MKKILAILLAGTLAVSSTAVAFAGTAPKRGDVNLDGKVDIVDATTIQNICADLGEYSAEQMTAADADNDGKVIISDATYIQEIVAGLIDPDEEEPETLDPAEVKKQGNEAMRKFSAELLKSSVQSGKNTFVSPLSVMAALSMTANGAKGETLTEMEETLGAKRSVLNAYFKDYVANTPSFKTETSYNGWGEPNETVYGGMDIANSLWYNNNGMHDKLHPNFVSDALKYYNAEVFATPFGSDSVDALNSWINEKTHEMIPHMIDEMPDEALLYLVNTVAFQASWLERYDSQYNVHEATFTDDSGKKSPIELMYSEEPFYLKDGDQADGFMKEYAGYRYAFAALLPKEGTKLTDYVKNLTGERLEKALCPDTKTYDHVEAALPKFKVEYDDELSDNLKAMGMPSAFVNGKANFLRMVEPGAFSPYIDEVLHKTFIDVNESGTKAAAATVVEVKATATPDPPKTITIRLDRPFVYMIVDTENNLPVFIGAMETM